MITKEKIDVGCASEKELDEILLIQAANQRDKGGSLSGSIPRPRLMEILQEMPIVVARTGGRVTGYLISGSMEMYDTIPVVGAMIEAYPGSSDSYVYGPICVREEDRGKGIAKAMFTELRRQLPGREGVLFVRADNPISIKVHTKMDMREVTRFEFEEAEFVVFSYVG